MRSEVGSLMQMAAAAVGRAQVPWRAIFHKLSHEGEDHQNCLATLEDNIGSYVVSPPATRRSHRPSQVRKGKTIRLSTATLIIVPQNILSQWKDEINLHVEEHFLEVLYLDSDTTPIPPTISLLKYDIILMSRQRFEREMDPKGTTKAGSRSKAKFKGMHITSKVSRPSKSTKSSSFHLIVISGCLLPRGIANSNLSQVAVVAHSMKTVIVPQKNTNHR